MAVFQSIQAMSERLMVAVQTTINQSDVKLETNKTLKFDTE
jgi:hypothetical protein